MKKLLLIAVLAVSCVAMNAQEGLQGTWFAGGELGFKTSKAGELKQTNATILPIVGTFISPSVAVGAGLGYSWGNEKLDGTKLNKSSAFIIQPLVRKYWNITGGLYFFGQAALPVSFGSSEDIAEEMPKLNSSSFGLQLSPGFDYIVNSWMTVETSFTIFNMGYTRDKYKGADNASNTFNLSANPFDMSTGTRDIGGLKVAVKFLF